MLRVPSPGVTKGAVCVHLVDRRNVGDHWSTPARHVAWLREAPILDLHSVRASALDGRLVIVGGGGLLRHPYFDRGWEQVRAADGATIVAWGIGDNLHAEDAPGSLPLAIDHPDWLTELALVGLRDWQPRWPWAPCVSCLHPAFPSLRAAAPSVDAVVYSNRRFPVERIEGLGYLTNDGTDLETALAFLSSARVVVTSSYHGAYWAALLGRRVVLCNAFSTKFLGMPWPVTVQMPGETWQAAAARTDMVSDALEVSLEATRDFSARVACLSASG
jgi:hypothetical protein